MITWTLAGGRCSWHAPSWARFGTEDEHADLSSQAGDGDDRFAGGLVSDSSFGGNGGDYIRAGGNDDAFLFGGSGVNTLFGGNGDDTLNAEAQGELQVGDFFDGGFGRDALMLASGVSLPGDVTVTNIELIVYS